MLKCFALVNLQDEDVETNVDRKTINFQMKYNNRKKEKNIYKETSYNQFNHSISSIFEITIR